MPANRPDSSDARIKRRLKQRRIFGAFMGLSLGFLAALCFRLTGYWGFSLEAWLWLVAATAGVHAALWLVLQLGWDRHLPWDPAFLAFTRQGRHSPGKIHGCILDGRAHAVVPVYGLQDVAPHGNDLPDFPSR